MTNNERSLIRGLSFALDDFEPFPAFFAPNRGVLQKLVDAGLVECGASMRPAVSTKGYRLTRAGWAVYEEISTTPAIGEIAL